MSALTPSHELAELFDVPFTFTERPRPVPGSLRPGWRIPAILLLVRKCRGARATLEQLHVLNWAIRDARGREAFLSFWRGEVEPDESLVRYEPALNRAIDLAVGVRLLIWNDAKRLVLTEQGRQLLVGIDADADLLADEKMFLAALASPISQVAIETLLKGSRK